jgi:hypothetical protein
MEDIDLVARKVVLNLEQLMAEVDYKYNRHQPCLVCGNKYKHHEDGLPCVSDDKKKRIVKYNYGRRDRIS